MYEFCPGGINTLGLFFAPSITVDHGEWRIIADFDHPDATLTADLGGVGDSARQQQLLDASRSHTQPPRGFFGVDHHEFLLLRN